MEDKSKGGIRKSGLGDYCNNLHREMMVVGFRVFAEEGVRSTVKPIGFPDVLDVDCGGGEGSQGHFQMFGQVTTENIQLPSTEVERLCEE